jgi:uncharacterized protein
MTTALITGASSGIGFQYANIFAREGHDVIMVSHNETKLQAAADKVQSRYPGVRVVAMPADLATEEGPRDLYAAVKKNELRVDVLVNNAGAGVYGDFAQETKLDDEIRMMRLNMEAPIILTKLFVQDMLRQGGGKLLFTASVSSIAPNPYLLVYSATKAFLYHFAEGLREELKDTQVSVTSLLPGETETNFFHAAGMDHTKTGQSEKDDPAEVAQAGYEAMMDDDDHVVFSMKNKLRVTMAKMMPDALAAKQGMVK